MFDGRIEANEIGEGGMNVKEGRSIQNLGRKVRNNPLGRPTRTWKGGV
jgi:hypothetical protein